MTNMLRIGFGVLIGAHGLAHIVGFLARGPWVPAGTRSRRRS
jgi:hypothetical protein